MKKFEGNLNFVADPVSYIDIIIATVSNCCQVSNNDKTNNTVKEEIPGYLMKWKGGSEHGKKQETRTLSLVLRT